MTWLGALNQRGVWTASLSASLAFQKSSTLEVEERLLSKTTVEADLLDSLGGAWEVVNAEGDLFVAEKSSAVEA